MFVLFIRYNNYARICLRTVSIGKSKKKKMLAVIRRELWFCLYAVGAKNFTIWY